MAAFTLVWTESALETFAALQSAAEKAQVARAKSRKTKASKQEGLFKQVVKTIDLLAANPRHPGLNTHEYDSIEHPYAPGKEKVFEAYVQNRTPGAFRLFWCYGPKKGEITVVAMTGHP